MYEIFELEIYSRPNQLLDQDFGKFLNHKFDDGLIVGLSNIPDDSDSKNLKIAIDEGEISVIEFNSFCIQYDLEQSIKNPESASKFIEFLYGVPIAWLHLPYSDIGLKLFQQVLYWAQFNGFNIQCSNNLYCELSTNTKPVYW